MKIYHYEDRKAKETKYYFPDVPYSENGCSQNLIAAIASPNNEVVEVDDWGRIAMLVGAKGKTGYFLDGTMLIIKAVKKRRRGR